MVKAKTVAGLLFIFFISIVIDSALAAGGRGSGHGGRSAHGGHGAHSGHGWHRGGHGHRSHRGRHSRGSRWSYGIFLGAPRFPYYPEPYVYRPYHYPPTAAGPIYSPDYVERGDVPESPAPANWWYYCAEADTYYPYVSECPGGWVQVAPQPPSN